MIALASHLSNIGGFCNADARRRIDAAKRLLVLATANPITLEQVRVSLPFIAGIEVDFNKRPFGIIKFSLMEIFKFEGKK